MHYIMYNSVRLGWW